MLEGAEVRRLRMSPGMMRVAVMGSAEEASEATDGLAGFFARVESEKKRGLGLVPTCREPGVWRGVE